MNRSKIGRRYGWKRDPIWIKAEAKYSIVEPVGILPSSVDLRPNCPPVYDQLSLGSCTSHAAAGIFEFMLLKQKLTDFVPSRLKIYYDERVIDGDVSQDAGSSISTSVEVLSEDGVCNETLWPYDITKFTVQPPADCYTASIGNKATVFKKVANAISPSILKLCLSEGYPFIFGFTVYESFESAEVASTGIVPMPATDSNGNITEQVIGGHAVMAVGYDDATERFTVRNSWGTNWGQAGYFEIPYAYLDNVYLANDFWTVESVS